MWLKPDRPISIFSPYQAGLPQQPSSMYTKKSLIPSPILENFSSTFWDQHSV